jgi:hypothetical protein
MQTDELAAGRLFPVAMLLRLTRGVANMKDVPSFLGCAWLLNFAGANWD